MKGFGRPPEGTTPPDSEMSKGTPASPELQAEYNKFVGLGLMALSNKDFLPQAQKMLTSSPKIENAMAQLGSTVAAKIFESAREQGSRISPEVLVHGGLEIMQHIGDMARAAGVGEVTDEQIETAYYLAADNMNDHMERSGAMADYQAEDGDEFMQSVDPEQLENLRSRIGSARDPMNMMGGA